MNTSSIVLTSYNLADAERRMCLEALQRAGTILDAAKLLGITRHSMSRRLKKYAIRWPPPRRAGEVEPD